MDVVIVESQTKANHIAEVLREEGRIVETAATGGSITEVKMGEKGFKLSLLPEKQERMKDIVSLSRGKDVFVASDCDREGELIALSLFTMLRGIAKSVSRSEMRDMTRKTICSLFDRVRDIDLQTAYSAMLRSCIDRNIGTIYSKKCSSDHKVYMPVGRVQVPVIAHLADGPYRSDELFYPPRTGDVLAWCGETKNMKPRETMRRLQDLYEKGKISYIRTDSAAPDEETVQYVRSLMGLDSVSFNQPKAVYEQRGHGCIRYMDFSEKLDDPVYSTLGELLERSLTNDVNRIRPKEHTEASVIRYMQATGLGRPSTYVSSLEKVRENGYAGENMKITEKGKRLLEWIDKEIPVLRTYTVFMEKTLQAVEKGGSWRTALKDLYNGLVLPKGDGSKKIFSFAKEQD